MASPNNDVVLWDSDGKEKLIIFRENDAVFLSAYDRRAKFPLQVNLALTQEDMTQISNWLRFNAGAKT